MSSSWQKHYVVKDKNKKWKKPMKPPKPRKKRRYLKLVLFLFVLFFVGGLGIGLWEDKGFDLVVQEVLQATPATSIQERKTEELWKQAVESYPVIYTKHFLCRMECRGISLREMVQTLENGEALTEKLPTFQERFPHSIVTKVRGFTHDQRTLDVVLSVDVKAHQLRYVTIIDPGIKRYEDPCKIDGRDLCK